MFILNVILFNMVILHTSYTIFRKLLACVYENVTSYMVNENEQVCLKLIFFNYILKLYILKICFLTLIKLF